MPRKLRFLDFRCWKYLIRNWADEGILPTMHKRGLKGGYVQSAGLFHRRHCPSFPTGVTPARRTPLLYREASRHQGRIEPRHDFA
jgi:hypothetical protein